MAAEARLEEVEAENERHRKANLVRAVLDGINGVEEYINEASNEPEYDRVPWLVAEAMKGRAVAAESRVAELEAALAKAVDARDALAPTRVKFYCLVDGLLHDRQGMALMVASRRLWNAMTPEERAEIREQAPG
jgi:hypothetical protein